MSPSNPRAVYFLMALLLTLSGCGDKSADSSLRSNGRLVSDPQAALIWDETAASEERIERMESLRPPVSREVAEALLYVMKDRTQQTFIMEPDDSVFGYRTVEGSFNQPYERVDLRWTAILAIERLALIQALPDLISALFDEHEVVRHFAARALWRFGSKEGLPILVAGLEGKALSNESANRILKEITGKDFGFATDIGWARKSKAIELYRDYIKTMKPLRPMPRMGENADLDRRVRYHVKILGDHQFLHMEKARRNLGMLGDLATEHIAKALGDKDLGASNQQLRAYAVQALAKIDTPKSRRVIVEVCARDEAPPVRSRAALAMGRMPRDLGYSVLMGMLKDSDESVIIAATRALGAMGGKGAIKALEAQYGESGRSKRWRTMTAFSLVRLGSQDPQFGALLAEIMTKGKPYEKAELADLLTEWKGSTLGWDERVSPEEQPEAIAKWLALFRH